MYYTLFLTMILIVQLFYWNLNNNFQIQVEQLLEYSKTEPLRFNRVKNEIN